MKMTDDYLDIEEITFGWEYFAESPALVKRNGYYYIFGSHLTGWNPNDNVSQLPSNPFRPNPDSLPGLQLCRVPVRPLVRVD